MAMLSLSPDGRYLLLPALTTVHSHAFQRAMRGAAQRPRSVVAAAGREDFWSWRGAMYRAASALNPESIEHISRVAFRELRRAGVRTVGEFHYVHHQADGTPYDDRTVMSDAVIRAAKDEGLRVSLLRVAYHRAGPGRTAEPGQRPFCDASVDDVLRDVDALSAKYKNDPDVRIGLAPHSVRAVPPQWIAELGAHAARHQMPFHMHVAEQPREIDECIAETGKRPVELLAELGVLSERFVAVHATHLSPREAQLFGRARAFACVCATTEADLGDGLPDSGALRAAGARRARGSIATSSRTRSRSCARSRPSSGSGPAGASRSSRRRPGAAPRPRALPPRSSGAPALPMAPSRAALQMRAARCASVAIIPRSTSWRTSSSSTRWCSAAAAR